MATTAHTDVVSARLVAGGVMIMSIASLIVAEHAEWLLFVLTYGFLARVLAGPTLSPLGQLVTRVITPRQATHDDGRLAVSALAWLDRSWPDCEPLRLR